MTSAHQREMSDAFFVCGTDQRGPNFFRGNDVVMGMQADHDGAPVLFAVIGRPVADQRFCGVPYGSDNSVFFPVVHHESQGRKLMRSVPFHYAWSPPRKDIPNPANLVPMEAA